MIKIKLLLTLLLALATLSCSHDWLGNAMVTPHYSIFYSKEFAKRFSLPIEKAVTLNNPHLKAMAIGIREVDQEYQCQLHLYYDNSIKLFSINDQPTFYQKSLEEIFFVKNANDEDFQYNYSQVSKNSSPAYIRSKSIETNKTGLYSSVRYASYKEHFLPNLNIASFNVGCHNLRALFGDAEIWIQKAGIPDYNLIDEDPMNIKHKENNYRFDIPVELLKTVAPQIDKIYDMETTEIIAFRTSVQYGKLDH